jgi:hypothetical protein
MMRADAGRVVSPRCRPRTLDIGAREDVRNALVSRPTAALLRCLIITPHPVAGVGDVALVASAVHASRRWQTARQRAINCLRSEFDGRASDPRRGHPVDPLRRC